MYKHLKHNKTVRRSVRGQAMVEFALMSLFLAMLLAGAVDFGRAYYTSIVVENMAGEGAAFAALFPDQDGDTSNQTCSTITPVVVARSIQERARKVAKDRGLVIETGDQTQAVITVTTDNRGSACRERCAGRTITVRVTYTLNDLFLPKFLGMTSIPISKSASQIIMRDLQKNGNCS